MRILERPLSVMLLTVAMVTGNLAVCAGWTATPEARMACCTDDRTCPMHASDDQETGAPRILTQAQADSCCASSEPEPSAASSAAFALAAGLAPVSVPASLAIVRFAEQPIWRTGAPAVATDIPKHLFLSVLLV